MVTLTVAKTGDAIIRSHFEWSKLEELNGEQKL